MQGHGGAGGRTEKPGELCGDGTLEAGADGARVREAEERGGLAVGPGHVVDFLKRSGPAECRTGQTVLAPEGARVVGDDLDGRAHPDRGGPGQAYEVGGERVVEADALQREGRGYGQDQVLGVECAGRDEHVEAALAVGADGGDGGAQPQSPRGQGGSKGGGDALRPRGETA